jgi:hypothetical protein
MQIDKRKLILSAIFIFAAVHLLKDITQDILEIPTFLDVLGDIREDTSKLPGFVQTFFNLLGPISFLVEGFLLISIPRVFNREKLTALEKVVYLSVLLLLTYFVCAMFLDPRFKTGLKLFL